MTASMATVEETVKVERVVKVKVGGFTATLSLEEARALRNQLSDALLSSSWWPYQWPTWYYPNRSKQGSTKLSDVNVS